MITAVVAGLLVVIGAVPSTAQVATPTFDDLIADGHRGKIVSVTDHGGTKVKGRVVSISATSIDLRVRDGSREWAASDVARITQRRGHAGRGAKWGLAVGFGLGALLVLTDPACQKNSDAWGCGAGSVLVAGAFVGGIGSGLGAVTGAAIRTDRVLYAAPSSSPHAFSLHVAPGDVGMRAQLQF